MNPMSIRSLVALALLSAAYSATAELERVGFNGQWDGGSRYQGSTGVVLAEYRKALNRTEPDGAAYRRAQARDFKRYEASAEEANYNEQWFWYGEAETGTPSGCR